MFNRHESGSVGLHYSTETGKTWQAAFGNGKMWANSEGETKREEELYLYLTRKARRREEQSRSHQEELQRDVASDGRVWGRGGREDRSKVNTTLTEKWMWGTVKRGKWERYSESEWDTQREEKLAKSEIKKQVKASKRQLESGGENRKNRFPKHTTFMEYWPQEAECWLAVSQQRLILWVPELSEFTWRR